MIIAPVTELTLIGVADPGVPNSERIALRPTEQVNLAQFGIMVGFKHPNGTVTPFKDNFFWFGEFIVEPPSWILVYTGRGEYSESLLPGSAHRLHTLYWGRPVTMFGMPNIVPVLFRTDGILVGSQLISQEPKQLGERT